MKKRNIKVVVSSPVALEGTRPLIVDGVELKRGPVLYVPGGQRIPIPGTNAMLPPPSAANGIYELQMTRKRYKMTRAKR